MTKLLITALLFATVLLLSLDLRAVAASDDPVPLCEPIAMGGGIMVYRCEPDEGPSFLLNSLGFMLVED